MSLPIIVLTDVTDRGLIGVLHHGQECKFVQHSLIPLLSPVLRTLLRYKSTFTYST